MGQENDLKTNISDDESSSNHSLDLKKNSIDFDDNKSRDTLATDDEYSSPRPSLDEHDDDTVNMTTKSQNINGDDGLELSNDSKADLVEVPHIPDHDEASSPINTRLSNQNSIPDKSIQPPLPSRGPPALPPRRRAPFFWLKGNSIGSDIPQPLRNQPRSSNLSYPEYDLILQRLDANKEGLESKGIQEKDAALNGRRQIQASFEEVKDDLSRNDHSKQYDHEGIPNKIDWEFWSLVVSDYDSVVRKNPAELSQAIAAGFPEQLRGLIWQLISSSKSSSLEEIFNQIQQDSSPHEKAIKRDLLRTSFSKNLNQDSLFRIIKCYSLFDPEVGYTQGMAFLTVPLLMNMTESEAFCLLVKLMKDYGLRDLFLPEMPGLHLKLYQYDRILEDTLPAVHIHLSRQGVRSSMYASQWFLTLFAYKFPLTIVMRIFDIVISEGLEAILRFGVALMKRSENEILSRDFESLLTFLKEHIFDYYRVEGSSITDPQYRVNDLVQDAFSIKVHPMTLSKYEGEYAEIHRLERQRSEEVERLRTSNGNLSLQVRRLEEQLAALNSEHIQVANEMVQSRLKLAKLQDENEQLLGETSQLKSIVNNFEETQNTPEDNLRSQNRQLLDTKSHLESQLDSQIKETVQLRMSYEQLTNDHKSLQQKWDSLIKHIQT